MNPVRPGLSDAPSEVRTGFRRLILGLADTKRILGIRYSDWLLGAPSIEAGIAASSMAQDEWGHARLLYASLKDFGEDPLALEHERDAAAYRSWDPLDEALPDWAAVTAATVIVDGALAVALEGVLESAYDPLAGRIEKMLGEEEFHRSLGEAWFKRLAASEGEGRTLLDAAVDRMLEPVTLCLAPGDQVHEGLADRGLTLPSGSLRRRFASRVDPMLKELGTAVPVGAAPADGWDLRRGRGSGRPAEEAVERARGDRNRALFVE